MQILQIQITSAQHVCNILICKEDTSCSLSYNFNVFSMDRTNATHATSMSYSSTGFGRLLLSTFYWKDIFLLSTLNGCMHFGVGHWESRTSPACRPALAPAHLPPPHRAFARKFSRPLDGQTTSISPDTLKIILKCGH